MCSPDRKGYMTVNKKGALGDGRTHRPTLNYTRTRKCAATWLSECGYKQSLQTLTAASYAEVLFSVGVGDLDV